MRQGVGGPNSLDVGADVIGHVHVGNDSEPNTGDVIEVESSDGWKKVKLNFRAQKDCYNQKGEDEIGFSFVGKIIG